MTTRRATNAELLEKLDIHIRNGWRVGFRHFMAEELDRRTKTGVRHRDCGSAKVHVIDGVPHVKHRRKLEPITATWKDAIWEWDGEKLTEKKLAKPVIWDVRIDSEYLRPIEGDTA